MRGDDDRLSQTFSALANSTRRAILARLAEGEVLSTSKYWSVQG
jgi:DNA-binding transcriptional ArsR family regulator